MIVAFSTSSQQTSVALIAENGSVIGAGDRLAPMQASGACMSLLQGLLSEHGHNLGEATLFLADLGPGSFTGVKVAVTIAKTLAFAHETQAAGADSFDLISRDQVVVLPSKRGEYFIRVPGQEPIRSSELPGGPYLGYGPDIPEPRYPSASSFASLLSLVQPMVPELLVPNYLIEPSISQPKAPLSPLGTRHE